MFWKQWKTKLYGFCYKQFQSQKNWEFRNSNLKTIFSQLEDKLVVFEWLLVHVILTAFWGFRRAEWFSVQYCILHYCWYSYICLWNRKLSQCILTLCINEIEKKKKISNDKKRIKQHNTIIIFHSPLTIKSTKIGIQRIVMIPTLFKTIFFPIKLYILTTVNTIYFKQKYENHIYKSMSCKHFTVLKDCLKATTAFLNLIMDNSRRSLNNYRL